MPARAGGEGGGSTACLLLCTRFVIQFGRREGSAKTKSSNILQTLFFYLPRVIGVELTIYHDTNSSSSRAATAKMLGCSTYTGTLLCVYPPMIHGLVPEIESWVFQRIDSRKKTGIILHSPTSYVFLRMRVCRIATGLSEVRRTRNEEHSCGKFLLVIGIWWTQRSSAVTLCGLR